MGWLFSLTTTALKVPLISKKVLVCWMWNGGSEYFTVAMPLCGGIIRCFIFRCRQTEMLFVLVVKTSSLLMSSKADL